MMYAFLLQAANYFIRNIVVSEQDFTNITYE